MRAGNRVDERKISPLTATPVLAILYYMHNRDVDMPVSSFRLTLDHRAETDAAQSPAESTNVPRLPLNG